MKLSALSPRYEFAQHKRALRELSSRLYELAAAAASAGVALTMDAEEADRLELSLAIFERVFRNGKLAHYPGLGLAVQAYQKRAWRVLSWLEDLARDGHKVIPVRLVKGAYWDTEIKRAQEQGLERLSGVHAQEQHGRLLPRLCESYAAREPTLVPAIRDAQRAHRRLAARGRRALPFRVPTLARHGRGAVLPSSWKHAATSVAAACMRRSAVMRTCCPTWSADFSRTARTPRSSIGSCRRTHRSRRSSPIRSKRRPHRKADRIRGSRCRATCTHPSVRTRAA